MSLYGRAAAEGDEEEMSDDWIRRIQVGDVLRTDKVFRVVRSVTHHPCGRTSVCFSIRHCSWTRRPITVLCSSDLKSRGYRPAGVRVKLNTELDAALAEECKMQDKPKIKCCDVRGIS